MVLTTVGGIGYILLATVETVGVRYFGVFLAASGIFPSEWLSPLLGDENRLTLSPSGIANILPWVTSMSSAIGIPGITG